MSTMEERFDAIEARLGALEAAVTGIVTKQEDDVTNNAGAMTTGYDAFAADGSVQYTITNLREWGIKFKDLRGTEFFLGKASGSAKTAVAYGQSAEILALVAASDVTSVPV